MNKKILSILLVLIICAGTLCACGGDKKDLVLYNCDDFSVYMADGFKKEETSDYYCFYQKYDAAITALKEDFESLSVISIYENSDLYDYAYIVTLGNGFEESDIIESKTKDMYYIEYTNNVSNTDYFYLSAMYKGSDAFWLVTFMCLEEDMDEFEPIFIEWAETVSVK